MITSSSSTANTEMARLMPEIQKEYRAIRIQSNLAGSIEFLSLSATSPVMTSSFFQVSITFATSRNFFLLKIINVTS